MAIFGYEVRKVSRADGRSATAAAAYRSAEKIHDERTGQTHDYRRKAGVLSSEIVLPDGARPMDRAELWNAAESAEKRKDAKVARESILSLPCELNDAERQQLTREHARWLADRHGVAVDASIHAPSRKGDGRNHHAHLLMTTRTVGPDGLGEKTRDLDVNKTASVHVEAWRAAWADHVNRSLERGEKARGLEAGAFGRVDHRSLERQGSERQPEPKLGPIVTAMERRGEQTRVGDKVREVREHNAEVVQIAQERERREQAAKAQEKPQTAPQSAQEAARDDKERRELELYRRSLEQAAERKLEALGQKHARELRPFQSDSQAPQRQGSDQAQPSGLFSRMADRLNPARVRERQAEEEHRKREAEDRRHRELEALLRRQEAERAALERQIEDTRRQKVQEFQGQQAKVREQRAKAPQVIDRQRTQERGDFGRERERERPGRPGRGDYSR